MSEVCNNCGTSIDVSGLQKSYGGHDLYCKTCGNQWHID